MKYFSYLPTHSSDCGVGKGKQYFNLGLNIETLLALQTGRTQNALNICIKRLNL
jgi:hypothetical protein